VTYYNCDITSNENAMAVATEVRKDVGDAMLVIANAGINRNKPVFGASQKDIGQSVPCN